MDYSITGPRRFDKFFLLAALIMVGLIVFAAVTLPTTERAAPCAPVAVPSRSLSNC